MNNQLNYAQKTAPDLGREGIENSLAALAQQVVRLHDEFSMLTERLSPILSPMPGTPAVPVGIARGDQSTPARASLWCLIEEIRTQVERISLGVEGLRNNVEL